jgi:DNA invertase Pin-like site-specific DNA recombinase
VHELTKRVVGFKVLSGQGASIDTTTPAGKFVFGIFAALFEFERELNFRADQGRSGLRACPWPQGRGAV